MPPGPTMSERSQTTLPTTLRLLIAKAVPVLLVLGILGLGWFAVHEINTGSSSDVSDSEESAAPSDSVITLPEGKLRAGGFRVEPAEEQLIQHVHVVPGRIHYNELRHIDIPTPVDGILIEILVSPGDDVKANQLLAVISSPTIDVARADVLLREAELKLAKRRLEREQEVAVNFKLYLAELDHNTDLDSLDKQFSEHRLGRRWQGVQSAYARLQLATDLYKNIRPLVDTKAVAGRTIREREADVQVARAEFRSAREQSLFETEQDLLKAQTAYSDAQRRVEIAHEHLELLLGHPEETSPAEKDTSLARLEVRAPISGTIVSRVKAGAERVLKSDVLFVLADTTTLYVAADIRENDWPAVSLKPGTEIKVTVPAIPDREFTASVHHVGREVMPETNAVPLKAKIDNREGLLRPGMFARVELPVGPPKRALSVPPESILQHEDQKFVFVRKSENTFQKKNISTGLASDKWTEVKDGLQQGQAVVTRGAFLLKSELLLEGE